MGVLFLLGSSQASWAQSADVSLTKTAPATVTSGQNMTYTLTLSNAGPDAAANVTVTDVLPAGETFVSATPSQGSFNSATGVWTVGTVTTGAPQTLTLTVNVTAAGGTLTNTATATSTTADPNPANNTSTASTTVTAPSADLSLTKTAPATVTSGQNMTYPP